MLVCGREDLIYASYQSDLSALCFYCYRDHNFSYPYANQLIVWYKPIVMAPLSLTDHHHYHHNHHITPSSPYHSFLTTTLLPHHCFLSHQPATQRHGKRDHVVDNPPPSLMHIITNYQLTWLLVWLGRYSCQADMRPVVWSLELTISFSSLTNLVNN